MSASTAVHSNAFNFQSYLQHGVDPRTGQYTVSLGVPELKCHGLAGPVLPLRLSFSPINTLDVGFGLGWTLNLTEYHLTRHILSLGTGETFLVTGSGATPDIEEKKLDSFHFHQQGDGRFRVVHRSGLVEILHDMGSSQNRLALPEEVRGPDGRSIKLTYKQFGSDFRLETVSDDSGQLLRIERNTDEQVELLFFPGQGADGGAMSRFVMHLDSNRRVTRVVLPTEEQACWKLSYHRDNGCISEVRTPTGAFETLEYLDGGHLFPGGGRPALPRVTRHRVDPRRGQPVQEVTYAYSTENFLGYGSGLSDWDSSGRDNLYRAASNAFTYSTTATHIGGEGVTRVVKRTFNRFHLLREEQTTQGACKKTVTTRYYADDPANVNRPFADQPPQCQLPMSVETRWEMGAQSRVETVQTRFDGYGNPILQINADGTREVSTYYPVGGVDGECPADPEGFVRSLRTRTVQPAPSDYGEAPTLKTDYRYAAVTGLLGAPFLVEVAEILSQDGSGELRRIETEYYDSAQDTLRLGREKTVTEKMNNLSTVTDYQYDLGSPDTSRAGQRVLEVIETLTGFDGTHRATTLEHSVLNGEPLLVQDENGVDIRYTYDALNRVTSETVAPESIYAATREYTYFLVGENDESQAWQRLRDVKGVHTRTLFDGLARAVREERQDVDAAQAAGRDPAEARYRFTYMGYYNALGEQVREIDIDWLGERNLGLQTDYGYDEWGERKYTKRPDGVIEHNVLDPLGTEGAPAAVRRSWLEAENGTQSGVTETWLDLFGEPVLAKRTDTGGEAMAPELHRRDGLGRVAQHINALLQTTHYVYDAFDRVVSTRLPNENQVVRSYAPHSAEDLPVSIAVNGDVLGTQTFDGLNRKVEAVTGGRKRTLRYKDGNERPFEVETPAGNTIEYEYLPQLGEEVTLRHPKGGVPADYTYDLQNARMTHCKEQGVDLDRTYYSTGELKSETRTENGQEETTDYDYSLRGRLLSCTVLGTTQTYEYDTKGRLDNVSADGTVSTWTYHPLGWVQQVASHDGSDGHALTTDMGYDDFGRETSRTFNEDGYVRSLALTYDELDRLTSQELKEGETLLRREEFYYDLRGRLLRHECRGSELPMDAFGNPFTRQVFSSDHLDNITQLLTFWPDNSSHKTEYLFEGEDPVQLTGITYTPPEHPPVTLSYDADGNLQQDEQGNTLHYDALGRLTGVDGPGAQAISSYRYDALDILASTTTAGRTERRLYQEDTLAARVNGPRRSLYLRGGGRLLAEQMTGDASGSGTVLLGTDRKNTVLGEVRSEAQNHAAYTAYGLPSSGPLWTQLGYNGELHEATPDGQLLGNGYRVFNHALQRFTSPDDLSPFDQGGLNPYAYCGNEPVNATDPSGHFLAPLLGVLGAAAIGGAIFVEDEKVKVGLGILGGILSVAALGAAVGRSNGSYLTRREPKDRFVKEIGGGGTAGGSKPSWTKPDNLPRQKPEQPLSKPRGASPPRDTAVLHPEWSPPPNRGSSLGVVFSEVTRSDKTLLEIKTNWRFYLQERSNTGAVSNINGSIRANHSRQSSYSSDA